MNYFSGIDPLYNLAKTAGYSNVPAGQTVGEKEATKQFTAVFYKELMKQTYGSESGLFSASKSSGYFGDVSQMSDVFFDSFVQEIISTTDISDIVRSEIIKERQNF